MKNLLLVSSLAEVAELLPAFCGAELHGKKLAFIPTASLVETITFYVDDARQTFGRLGLQLLELDIASADPLTISQTLHEADYLYISGGNTFYLLQALQQNGAGQLIRELVQAGKPYIGESAGSIVLAADIAYIAAMDERAAAPALTDTAALGLVDFYPLPHQGHPYFAASIDSITREFGQQLALYPFSNEQAIVVRGETVKQLGPSA